jgi:nucleoside-diphosphate-sugar epimerase
MSKESVLITGANGFVGSKLCSRFLDEGYRVIAGIREGCDATRIIDFDIEYRFGDITEPDTLGAMTAGVDYIIHNAGLVKTKNPQNFFKINRDGTTNILEAAGKNGSLKKFVLISSLAAAGPSKFGKPLTEEDEPQPLSVYGQSKLESEKEVLQRADRINCVILRPPGIYGPGDMETLAFFETLNNRIKPYLGNLKRKIQMVHIDDLTRGVLRSVQAETKSGSIYFIAEAESHTYRYLVKCIREAVDRWALPLYFPGWAFRTIAFISQMLFKLFGKSPMLTVEKANEILAEWEVSIARAEKELGYKPLVTFADGARETLWWYRTEGIL